MTTYQTKWNLVQIRLMKDAGIDLTDKEKILKWINRYAKRFRDIVDSGIEDYEKIRAIIYLKPKNEMLKHKILWK